MKHIFKITLIPLMVLVFLTGVVHAVTQGMNATLRFLDPLTIDTITNPDLGDWLSTASTNLSYNMDTTGAITGTAQAAGDFVGSNVVGTITIHGSATGLIDIVAQNFVANSGIGIISVPCKYGAAVATSCNGAGIVAAAAPTTAGTVLLIGMNAQATTAQADGDTPTPTFDIVVTYN